MGNALGHRTPDGQAPVQGRVMSPHSRRRHPAATGCWKQASRWAPAQSAGGARPPPPPGPPAARACNQTFEYFRCFWASNHNLFNHMCQASCSSVRFTSSLPCNGSHIITGRSQSHCCKCRSRSSARPPGPPAHAPAIQSEGDSTEQTRLRLYSGLERTCNPHMHPCAISADVRPTSNVQFASAARPSWHERPLESK